MYAAWSTVNISLASNFKLELVDASAWSKEVTLSFSTLANSPVIDLTLDCFAILLSLVIWVESIDVIFLLEGEKE